MLCGLRDRKLHAALLVHPSAKALIGLTFHPLLRLPAGVAVAPSHPLSRSRTISLAKLAEERLIAYSRKDYPEHRDWIERLFAPLGHRPAIAEEHNSSTSLIAPVEAGRGVALVQDGLQALAGTRVKIRRIVPEPAPYVVGLAYREDSISINPRFRHDHAKPRCGGRSMNGILVCGSKTAPQETCLSTRDAASEPSRHVSGKDAAQR